MMLVFVQFITTRLALPLYLKYTDSSFTRLKMLKGFYKLFREVKKKKKSIVELCFDNIKCSESGNGLQYACFILIH